MENISLDNVKLLIDEMDYYNDIKEENEEKLVTVNEEVQIFVNLYDEFNRKSNQNKADLKIFQKELEEINEKQVRLDGKISKKNSDRKKYLEEKIESLKSEIVIAQENKKEARISYNDIMKNNPNLEISQNISKLNNEIEIRKQKLEDTYKYCISKINDIESKIENKKQSIADAVNNHNYDLLESLSLELSELVREKNNSIFKYKEIVGFLEKMNVKNSNIKNDEISDIEDIEDLEDSIIEQTNNLINNNENNDIQESSEDKVINNEDEYKTAIVEKGSSFDNSDKPIFVDESRINENYSWMTPDNAYNTNNIVISPEIQNEDNYIEEQLNNTNISANNNFDIIDKNNEINEKSVNSPVSNLLGKITNISVLPKYLNELIMSKINLGKLKISAGNINENEESRGR